MEVESEQHKEKITIDAEQIERLQNTIIKAYLETRKQVQKLQTETQQLSERIEMLTLYIKVRALERSRHLYFRSWEEDQIIEKWKARGQRTPVEEPDEFLLNALFVDQ